MPDKFQFVLCLTPGTDCDCALQRAAISHQLTLCITEPLFNSALKRAEFLDSYLERTGKPFGPLHGIPVTIKDMFNVKGVDSSIGIAALAFKPATENAPIVDLLHSLGAIIIAKTNVPQTLASLDSVNNVFGRTMNPLNRKLTAGGSSGGEGVLIAMRGSMIGLGTDIGGSIRIPAMCTGVYGFKPSAGRVPFGGLVSGQPSSLGRTAIQAVGGPLASTVADLGVFMREVVPRAELWGEDCIPGKWESETAALPEAKSRPFTVGVLRSDGIVEPLPPIAKILDEVAHTLRGTRDVQVVEIPVPPALKKCQSLANSLMGVDGARMMMDLLESKSEPLVPWLQGRMKRGKPKTLDDMYELNNRRSEIEREMMNIWTTPSSASDASEFIDKTRKVDAIICPIAPHPVPEIDRYNAVGYTSTFVLLDYPAGTIPVRNFQEADLETGKEITSEPWTSWDKRNRELCMYLCLLSPFAFIFFAFY